MLKRRRVSPDRAWHRSAHRRQVSDHEAGYDKGVGAGWWEVSGGACQAGETSKEAVLREVQEETGLDVSGWDGGYLFSYKRENPGEGDNYFVDIYRFTADFDEADIHLQEEETDGWLLATPEEIKAFAAQGIFLHYDSIKRAFELSPTEPGNE